MSEEKSEYKQRLNKARAMDRFLAKKAEIISNQQVVARTKVKFDGTHERHVSGSNHEMMDRIASCREAYENVGIIGNIVDLMVDFALEGLTIEHASKPIRNFFIHWANKVKLYSLAEEILKGIYRDGNVPILSFRGAIENEEVIQFKKAIAQNLFVDTFTETKIIPYKYLVLDVLRLWKIGSELLGNVKYEYQIGARDLGIIKGNNQEDAKFVKKLKDSLGDNELDNIKKTGRISIPNNRLSLIFYKKDSYKAWANPMLWRIIEDVKFKQLLREMDISVAESVINALTIIKLGKTVDGFPAPPGKYTKLASLLKTPTRSKTIIWDDLIELQTAYPPVNTILGREKYEQVNDDIRSGLGIAEVLINGEGGNFANSFLSVRTLLERLETGRQMLIGWLEAQIEIVTKNMGFRKAAIIKLENMSLMDEQAEKRLLLELYDRNLVSAESMIEHYGENFNFEMIRMKREDSFRNDLRGEPPFRLLKIGKFGPQLRESFIFEDDTQTNDLPGGQEQNGPDGGRPIDDKKKQSQPPGTRKSKPKGQSSQEISPCDIDKKLLSSRFNRVYDLLKKTIINTNGYKSDKELVDTDLDSINEMLIKILPTAVIAKRLTKNIIEKALIDDEFKLATAPAKLDRCVKEVVNKAVKEFKKKNNKPPSKKKMQEITSRAFAICTTKLKK